MKHARKDYNRIQDPEKKIPANEPVFLLRGQDKHAAAAVRFWANLVDKDGGMDSEIAGLARTHAEAMDAWPKKKAPDLSRDSQ